MRTPPAQCTPEQCAINNVLWTGQLFIEMWYKRRQAWHEVTWFAMFEFMLTPAEVAWHMHYALRYPGKRGGVEAQDVQAILQLDLNTHERITRRAVRIVMEQAYNLSFLYECRGIKNIEEQYQVPDHVTAKLLSMFAAYVTLPLETLPPGWDSEKMSIYALPNYEDIPEDIISGCLDIWDKYTLDIPMPDLCQEATLTKQSKKKKARTK